MQFRNNLLLFFALFILVTFSIQVKLASQETLESQARGDNDICNGNDGCRFAMKNFIMVPLIDDLGLPNDGNEDFNYKIMLVYDEKLIFFETDQNAYFDREKPPGKLLRTVSFGEVSLDCGKDGNKFCMVSDFMSLFPSYSINITITKRMDEGAVGKQCFVIPIVDGTDRRIGNSVVYICQQNIGLLRSLYILRNKISRLVDKYQLALTEDKRNEMNAIPRKIGTLLGEEKKSGDFIELHTYLYFHSLKGYKNPKNYASEIFSINLAQIHGDYLARPVKEGKKMGFVTLKDWGNYKTDKGISVADDCCMVIPLKEGIKPKPKLKFFCIDNPNIDCTSEISIWTTRINSFVNRIQYLDDFPYLLLLGDKVNCKTTKELKMIKNRLKNISDAATDTCFILRLMLSSYKPSSCSKDRTDEITEETRQVSQYERTVQDLLENCIKNGDIEVIANALAD